MNTINFWAVFDRNSQSWATRFQAGEARAVFDELESALEASEIPFDFDVTADEETCHLIFSPEGDKEVADAIDEFVRSAPNAPSWKIYSRRQRKDLEDVRAIIRHLFLVDIESARFRIADRDSAPLVEIYLPPDSDLDPEEQDGLANTLLWHLLGEGLVMSRGIHGRVHMSLPPAEGLLSAGQVPNALSL